MDRKVGHSPDDGMQERTNEQVDREVVEDKEGEAEDEERLSLALRERWRCEQCPFAAAAFSYSPCIDADNSGEVKRVLAAFM